MNFIFYIHFSLSSFHFPFFYWRLLRDHRKWWLTPVVIALLVLSLFALLSTSSAAPFIYTLF
jgi:drug/metabolite transporter superfamily protein YnfA